MKKPTLLILLVTSFCTLSFSQDTDRKIEFPDIPGYVTMSCDFHIHTVFSDGSVWPNIRVQEAVRDGLDAIALTEHLEYQPHEEDLPHPDRNRSYMIAKEQAKAFDLIIVHGAEITRDLPPGHANAIFIQDANKLVLTDSIEAYKEAKRQGGFIFWNHPNWIAQQRNGKATLTDLHRKLIKEGLLDGIEVVNDVTYSDEALQIALDQDLAIMGTSDIHGLVDWQYELAQGGHRPVTLVFATERSEDGIKSALEARRSVAWFGNLLIGKNEVLQPLIEASITVSEATYQGPSSVVTVVVENASDATLILQNRSRYTFHAHADLITLPAQAETKIQVKTNDQTDRFVLDFEVLNAVIAPNRHPHVTIPVKVDL